MASHLLSEQSHHEALFRAVASREGVKLYSRTQGIVVREVVSFDTKAPLPASLELFVMALASDLLLTLQREWKRLEYGALELAIQAKVENPLALLGVVGYEESARLAHLETRLYIEAEGALEAWQERAQRALERSLLYPLLHQQRLGFSLEVVLL